MKRNVAALLFALAAVPVASAELYKWVDEKGVTHYSDTPPVKGRGVVTLDESRSSLSVVPGLSKDELARAEARAEQARAERLERENAELRARLASTPAPAPRNDEPSVVHVPVLVPQVVTRRPPHASPVHPDPRRPPRAAPVQRTPPAAGMKLDR